MPFEDIKVPIPAKAANRPSNRRSRQAPQGLAFTHSMNRDGANHVLLYTLERLIRQGSPVTAIYSPLEGPMRPDFEALGVKVHVLPFTEPAFPALFRSLKADYVICNTMFRCDCICLAAEIGLPSMWVIHEAWTEKRIHELAAQGQLDLAKTRHAFTRCDKLVFVSKMQEEFYKKMFVIPQSRCQVIYNGIRPVDSYLQTADREVERAKLGYKPDDYVVLHIGTVSVRKGQLATAKAIAKLRAEGRGRRIKVLMVGDLKLNDMEKVTPAMYIDMIREHLAQHDVSFAFFEETPEARRGEATVTMMDVQSQVNRLYLAADAVVLPSLNEVLPMVLCEAMAFSRPVVSTSIDAIPEAVTHGDNGFLVAPGDEGVPALAEHIEALSEDAALAVRMGSAGRERVLRQFSLDVMGRAYRAVVDEIVCEGVSPLVAAAPTHAMATAGSAQAAAHTALLDAAPSASMAHATASGMPLTKAA